jgi:hypothetical protein
MAFHMLIIEASGNRRMIEVVKNMRTISRIFRTRRAPHQLPVVQKAYEYHSLVLGALRARDAEAASAALARARASQPLIDELRGALRGGQEVTRVSPMLRRRRRVLGKFAELAERTDYAMRNTRVLVRRTYTALCDDEPAAPELADVLGELATAVGVLTDQLGRDGDRTRAREPVLDVVRHARALEGTFTPGPSEVVIEAQLRSIALDLLQATGMTRPEALAAMRGSREDE